ncbi:MAG: hypothetical protein RLZZ179_3339 [Verrucomicrobiota bacterium]|jgi:hypothetical protein
MNDRRLRFHTEACGATEIPGPLSNFKICDCLVLLFEYFHESSSVAPEQHIISP